VAPPGGTETAPAATIAPAVRAESQAKPPRTSAAPRRAPRLETSAGGIVVRLVDGQPRILMIRDSYRNWGFPKGHLEQGETAADAALREVREETGLGDLALVGAIDTIDWLFRFRGRLVHKTCHFFLMHTRHARTRPQRSEGITACRWVSIDEAETSISYANARDVLRQARAMLVAEGLIRDAAPTVDAGA
jgi:8-oxo-dGTP pyrophosphatase MutT (NUDIX family)